MKIGGYSNLLRYNRTTTPNNNNKSTASTDKADKTSTTEKTAEFKNNTSLPDEEVNQIREMARQGAKDGVYMGEKFAAVRLNYMKNNISPNRSMAMSMFTSRILNAPYNLANPVSIRLGGLSGTIWSGLLSKTASVFAPNGEQILSYSSQSGWSSVQTKAEGDYFDETTAIYYEAYTAERARMKAEGTPDATGVVPGSQLNITV